MEIPPFDGKATSPTITDVDHARLYRLPGREWRLVLGPQNCSSRKLLMAIASLPAGSAPRGHTHELEDEVVYVLSGRGALVTPLGTSPLEPGVAFHIPAGLEHGAVAGPDATLELLCVFSPPVVPGSYDPIEEG